MVRLAVAFLCSFLVASCASDKPGKKRAPDVESTPRGTIEALAQAARDGDFATFFDLQASEALADERARWEVDRTSGRVPPGQTFRTFFITMLKRRAETNPLWFEHLKGLTLLDVKVEGNNALAKVRFGKPKEDEVHDVAMVRRDGVWLIRNWN